jgi:hypothetical protein
LWLAETSQQPISQTTWLKVTPHCNHCNHTCIQTHTNTHTHTHTLTRSCGPNENNSSQAGASSALQLLYF